MSDVRYVCMSDLHLGEKGSLLTNLSPDGETDPLTPSPVMESLVDCLRTIVSANGDQTPKPTLILVGDILELALTTTNEAAMVFEQFIQLVMPEDPAEQLFNNEIVFIPGNHDHHLWEMARESQFVDYLPDIPRGEEIPEPWHVTNMSKPPIVESFFLTRLIRRHREHGDVTIRTVYPNFAVFEEESERCVVFHHGHFVEDIYHAMSWLRTLILWDRQKPTDIWDIEAENFAWIDFFWSTLGRSGKVGKDVELVYKRVRDDKGLKRTLDDIANNLADKYNLPGPSWLEDDLARWALNGAAKLIVGHERKNTTTDLSDEATKGLKAYVSGPLSLQCKSEEKSFPDDTTIIFGHTHKPFEKQMAFAGFNKELDVFNTGGWVVDEVERRSHIGGAVVLLDDALNVASLRMYNESRNAVDYKVTVGSVVKGGQANPLADSIKNLVNADENPWREFSQRAASAISIRAGHLKKELEKE